MVIHDYQQTVVLADGTVLNGYGNLNETDDDLWIWLDDGTTDMVTAFGLFSDPAKTAQITVHLTAEITETHEGYTKMNLIRQDQDRVSIRMKKGV